MALVGRLRRPSPDALFSYRRFITLPARSAIFLSERFTSAVWIGRSPPFCLMESPRRRWPNRAEKTGRVHRRNGREKEAANGPWPWCNASGQRDLTARTSGSAAGAGAGAGHSLPAPATPLERPCSLFCLIRKAAVPRRPGRKAVDGRYCYWPAERCDRPVGVVHVRMRLTDSIPRESWTGGGGGGGSLLPLAAPSLRSWRWPCPWWCQSNPVVIRAPGWVLISLCTASRPARAACASPPP